jgi:2-oxo-4-hydroxy-4-carboxy-5-ureidoimidazoline decarboxylase
MENKQPSTIELLSKPPAEVAEFLGAVYEHSSWVAKELTVRAENYSSVKTVSQLALAMKGIVDRASREKKLALLCAHPDLCEKVGKLENLTKESQEEQSRSGLQSLTVDEIEIFNRFNSDYRARFGFPFILAVRNATKYTVLAALQGRVHNALEVEFATVMQQVHKIAWMRLLAKIDTTGASGFLTCHVLDTANGCPGTRNPRVLFVCFHSLYTGCSLLMIFFIYIVFVSVCMQPPV